MTKSCELVTIHLFVFIPAWNVVKLKSKMFFLCFVIEDTQFWNKNFLSARTWWGSLNKKNMLISSLCSCCYSELSTTVSEWFWLSCKVLLFPISMCCTLLMQILQLQSQHSSVIVHSDVNYNLCNQLQSWYLFVIANSSGNLLQLYLC